MGGGEKKGSRHPLGSREATQEANSPITCRTYRGFAIQASPSNTINIPSRMPGIHAAAESSICDGQRENDGRWKEGCGRQAGRDGSGFLLLLLLLLCRGYELCNQAFSPDRETRIREPTFANIYGMKYGEEGSRRKIPGFETRAEGRRCARLRPPPLRSCENPISRSSSLPSYSIPENKYGSHWNL